MNFLSVVFIFELTSTQMLPTKREGNQQSREKISIEFRDYVWFLTFQFKCFVFHSVQCTFFLLLLLTYSHSALAWRSAVLPARLLHKHVSFAIWFPFQGIFISLQFNVRAKFHNFSMHYEIHIANESWRGKTMEFNESKRVQLKKQMRVKRSKLKQNKIWKC